MRSISFTLKLVLLGDDDICDDDIVTDDVIVLGDDVTMLSDDDIMLCDDVIGTSTSTLLLVLFKCRKLRLPGPCDDSIFRSVAEDKPSDSKPLKQYPSSFL
mmetsp:Transcript_38677/g.62628  ORF Transcript_38677/g.62628 Transcript_38677/m.62628 type:complete len:101 (+) Transcript_38677:202-504(+)